MHKAPIASFARPHGPEMPHHPIQILLPLSDNQGHGFPGSDYTWVLIGTYQAVRRADGVYA